MAKILGLTVSHFPYLRLKYYHMPSVLMGNLSRGWVDKPHLKDPKNWPEPMQEEWGSDSGATTGKAAQAHQIEQFRKLRAALDDFKPDLMVFFYRDLGEAYRNLAKPQYWIHAHDKVQLKLFQIFGNRENYWEEDPDRVDTIYGHPEAAFSLARKTAGRRSQSALRARVGCPARPRAQRPRDNRPSGLGSAGVQDPHRPHRRGPLRLHADPEQRRPVALEQRHAPPAASQGSVQPWTRGREGLQGQPLARGLVAGTAWSHANDAGWEYERVHQDRDADARRFEEWKANKFTDWGDNWTFEEMEEHAQWELLISIILAGAMTEIGSKVTYADMASHWILNSTWVTTIFEPR